MRDSYDEIDAVGAGVAAIGMGSIEHAAHFRDDAGIPFPLLVDRRRETYRALEVKRGSWLNVIGPQVWLRGARSILSGNVQGAVKQDPRQLGATAVILRGGEIASMHRAKTAADNPDIRDVLKALR